MHLIPASSELGTPQGEEMENANVFKNLDSPVSEGGDNFSTGCVASLSFIDPVLT